jgi:hypothetical protein
MEFASDLACKVKEYNRWVQELQQSLEGGPLLARFSPTQ